MGNEKETEGSETFYDVPALIAKERQLNTTLRALQAMLEKVQDLRTKVNFERTQLITLIEMARSRGNHEMPMPMPTVSHRPEAENTDKPPEDPLLTLDKLYNGEFSMSEEEEDDDEDYDFKGHDDFGGDKIVW